MSEKRREAIALIRSALVILLGEQADEDRRFKKLMDAIRAEDEHKAVALGLEAQSHAFATREDATGVPDVDDPPSRDP